MMKIETNVQHGNDIKEHKHIYGINTFHKII